MAVRRRVVRAQPDTGMVSREEMREAFLDFEAVIACSGGTLTVVVERAPTDMPLEMVTSRALFEWKDHTNARPRPEDQVHVLTEEQMRAVFEELGGDDDEFEVPEPTHAEVLDAEPELVTVPEVDETSVPEDLRG